MDNNDFDFFVLFILLRVAWSKMKEDSTMLRF